MFDENFVCRYFSAEPHVAGSARTKELGQYMVDKWKSYGMKAKLVKYSDVMLSLPNVDHPNK